MSISDRQNVYEEAAAASAPSEGRKQFGYRLRMIRSSLGYTQEQMAYALGINLARYNKYEIGRSEAPYEVLCRIANVADVDLNYLIAGQKGRESKAPLEQLSTLLKAVPVPAVIYDRYRRLMAHNDLWRDEFFPDHPKGLLRRGTPQEVLIRAWAHAHGFDLADIEACVEARLDADLYADAPVELQIGSRRFHIAETVEASKRLVLITELTDRRRFVL